MFKLQLILAWRQHKGKKADTIDTFPHKDMEQYVDKIMTVR